MDTKRILFFAIIVMTAPACSSKDEEADTGPEPEVSVVAGTDMGVLEQSPRISGRDGGYSAVYENRSVWIYGDTFLYAADEDGYDFVGNTWSWTEDFDASDGIGEFREPGDSAGAPAQFFPLTAGEQAFNDAHKHDDCREEPCGARWALWPGAAVADPERNRMLVFYEKIYAEPGAFNFHAVGHSLAVWNDFDGDPERPVFRPGSRYPGIMFPAGEPGFGSAAVVVDGMLYVYGCDLDEFKKPCRIARVPLEFAEDRDAWAFYTGGGEWSGDIGLAGLVFNGNDMMTVYYNPYVERFLAVYSQPMDAEVMIRTAAAPEGPWSKAVRAFDPIEPAGGSGWVYDALAHPEYDRDGGRVIYVTYSRQIADFTFEVRLASVELEKAE